MGCELSIPPAPPAPTFSGSLSGSPPGLSSLSTRGQILFSISFLLNPFRTLPSSVSRKPCVCHSYENCRVYTNNSHYGTQRLPTTGCIPYPIPPISFLFTFLHTLLHSSKSQLFCFQSIPHSLPKTTRGGVPLSSPRRQNEIANRQFRHPIPSFRPIAIPVVIRAYRSGWRKAERRGESPDPVGAPLQGKKDGEANSPLQENGGVRI